LLGPLNEVEQQHAPKTLYFAGDAGILEQGGRVSIVGARNASPEGIRRAARLAGLLADRGIVVVSWLAEGVDTAAHEAAITHGGRTIAVLGTPLDQVYPKKNAALQHRIMREHLVISQYPPGYPVQPKNFPLRNRTMALLSDATVIIEASDTSGSLHQGWEALRLGRHLFITKSVAEDPGLSWPGKMTHYGARILSDDTLEEFLGADPRTDAGLSQWCRSLLESPLPPSSNTPRGGPLPSRRPRRTSSRG
jgi:DNA processing protein